MNLDHAKGFDFQSAKAVMEEINKLTSSYSGNTVERIKELGSL